MSEHHTVQTSQLQSKIETETKGMGEKGKGKIVTNIVRHLHDDKWSLELVV